MPRAARLDAPGVLHHVMIRGLERRAIFRDDHDRRDFLTRLGGACSRAGGRILAWALLPNHAHLLMRSGSHGLSALMRRLLTGYAGAFNRRHRRQGHLFQNRFKSVLVEEEVYLLELVRYIHLNPVRAGLVPGIAALDRYHWTGHAALLGRAAAEWQDVDTVLGHFGRQVSAARRGYRDFVAVGLTQGRRPELTGGGLRRSRTGWEMREQLRRGREHWAYDERVLGTSEFVQRVAADYAGRTRPAHLLPREAEHQMARLVRNMATAAGVSTAELCSGGRRRALVRARMEIAAAAVRAHGLPIAIVAHALGVSPRTVSRGAELPLIRIARDERR